MSERIKKIIVIALFALSVLGIGFALYWAFFRPTPVPITPTVEPETERVTGALPGTVEGGERVYVDEAGAVITLEEADEVARGDITRTVELSTGPVFETAPSTDGSAVNFYAKSDGRFYRLDEQGNVERLSDRQFPDMESATWNMDSSKAVLEFPDGSNIIYDFNLETQVTLPAHWEDFAFSPVRDQVIAKSIGIDPNSRYLVTTNADGSNVKAFQPLGENAGKVQVNWSPNDQVVAFADTAQYATGGNLDRRLILPLGKNQENFKGLIVEGLNFNSKWAPNGKRLLYSVSGSYSNYKPLLWIVDATPATMGDNRRSIALNTWVEKCTFYNATEVYCAVPNALPPNAGLQPSLFDAESDSVYKVNIDTGSVSLVAIPESETTMSDLVISTDGSKLYYRNTLTGELEMIRLK
jgi:WD40 repeat protein